jgi:hypothetical protein
MMHRELDHVPLLSGSSSVRIRPLIPCCGRQASIQPRLFLNHVTGGRIFERLIRDLAIQTRRGHRPGSRLKQTRYLNAAGYAYRRCMMIQIVLDEPRQCIKFGI